MFPLVELGKSWIITSVVSELLKRLISKVELPLFCICQRYDGVMGACVWSTSLPASTLLKCIHTHILYTTHIHTHSWLKMFDNTLSCPWLHCRFNFQTDQRAHTLMHKHLHMHIFCINKQKSRLKSQCFWSWPWIFLHCGFVWDCLGTRSMKRIMW